MRLSNLFKRAAGRSAASAEIKKPEAVTWTVPGGEVRELSKMVFDAEHTLIAGTTGAGKSVLLNGVLRDLLRSKAPCEARLYLIDPKALELDYLRELPHVDGYADTDEGALELLERVAELMRSRNNYCKERHLRKYPGRAAYVVIDELHALMTQELKAKIRPVLSLLLTQARAANIHIVALTQCPNRKALPADVVSLFTLRIGLRCADKIESRQIVGTGDCYLLPRYGKVIIKYGPDYMTSRVPMTDDSEVDELVAYWTGPSCHAA